MADIVKYAEALQLVVRELANRASGYVEKQAAVTKRVPEVIDTLVANSFITVNQKDVAAKLLSTHEGSLEIIERMAKKASVRQSGVIGEAVGGSSSTPIRRVAVDHIPRIEDLPAAQEFAQRILSRA
jgi:hypothetical protein